MAAFYFGLDILPKSHCFCFKSHTYIIYRIQLLKNKISLLCKLGAQGVGVKGRVENKRDWDG